MADSALAHFHSDRRRPFAAALRRQPPPTPVADNDRRPEPGKPATPYDEIWYRGRPQDP